MKIHEYQGKELFRKYGVPTPRGVLATTPAEAEKAAASLATPVVVVKAQIHAGARGKGGGVMLAKSPAEAKEIPLTTSIAAMNREVTRLVLKDLFLKDEESEAVGRPA